VQALTQQLWLIKDSAPEPFRPLVAAILIHSSRLGSLAIWKRKRVSPMEKNKGKEKGCKEFCVN